MALRRTRIARQVAPGIQVLQPRVATLQLAALSCGRRRRIEIAATPVQDVQDMQEPLGLPSHAARPLSQTAQRHAAARARRVARWDTVRRLHAQGVSLRQIARALGLTRQTVRQFTATPEPHHRYVEHSPLGGLPSPMLQPFVPCLQDRWQQGGHNIAQIHRELVALGYPGSRSLLYQALQPWRPPRPPPVAATDALIGSVCAPCTCVSPNDSHRRNVAAWI